jgi:hypothetical protein
MMPKRKAKVKECCKGKVESIKMEIRYAQKIRCACHMTNSRESETMKWESPHRRSAERGGERRERNPTY